MANIDPSIDRTTILYVDACVEKWEPFVKDADHPGRLSFLCEREANFWKSELEKPGAPVKDVDIGARLKYIFPTLKKLNELLAPGEIEFDQIHATADTAFEDILPEPVWCVWGMRDNRPSEKEKTRILNPLVERSHAALVDYEKIVSR